MTGDAKYLGEETFAVPEAGGSRTGFGPEPADPAAWESGNPAVAGRAGIRDNQTGE
jgi:hypothetical protein